MHDGGHLGEEGGDRVVQKRSVRGSRMLSLCCLLAQVLVTQVYSTGDNSLVYHTFSYMCVWLGFFLS